MMLGAKSQNISNLKSFVLSLEAESSGKQSELQQVVGSKYHDFIQSGHHIESMYEYSKNIEKSVLQFDAHSRNLLETTKKILQYKDGDKTFNHRFGSGMCIYLIVLIHYGNNNYSNDNICYFFVVTSETVWRCLNECDISGAIVACLSALYVLHLSGEAKDPSLPVLTFLLRAHNSEVKVNVKPNIRKLLMDASSLIQVCLLLQIVSL